MDKPKAYLAKLEIRRYRNVAATTLEFSPGPNILLGKNGSGKTSLLKLISEVVRGQLNLTKEPDLCDVSYELVFNNGRIKGSSRTVDQLRDVELPRDVDLPSMGQPKSTRAQQDSLEVYLKNGRRVLVEYDGQKNGLTADGEAFRVPNLEARGVAARAVLGTLGLLSTHHEEELAQLPLGWTSQHEAVRYDESLDYFAEIVSARHGPRFETFPVSTEENVLANLGGFAHRLSPALIHAVKAHIGAPEIELPSSADPWLAEAVEILGFKSASEKLSLRNSQKTDEGTRYLYDGLRFSFERRDGTHFTHELLSYGQKRLVGFLYYLAQNPNVIVVDELVNGFHHDWIDTCWQAIQSRQSFIASQNPLLLDYMTFASAEEALRHFVLCASDFNNEREHLTWRQMNSDEADSFFEAYEVGIEQVSQILRTRGLW